MKSGRKILISFILSAAILLNLSAQRGPGQLSQDNIVVPAGNENDTEIVEEDEFDEFDFFEFDEDDEDIIISQPESQNLDPRQKIMLQRELQRHENEIKKLNLMRRRAREMLRNSEEMRARELERHYKSVKEIQDR